MAPSYLHLQLDCFKCNCQSYCNILLFITNLVRKTHIYKLQSQYFRQVLMTDSLLNNKKLITTHLEDIIINKNDFNDNAWGTLRAFLLLYLCASVGPLSPLKHINSIIDATETDPGQCSVAACCNL